MKSILSVNPPKIFFDSSCNTFTPSNIHQHGHCEIQVVGSGSVEVTVNNKKILVNENEAILIPDTAFHSTACTAVPESFFGFQLEHHHTDVSVVKLPDTFVKDFFKKLKQGVEKNDASLYINQLIFITAELIKYNEAEDCPKDCKYIISEFFSLNYNKNITVADLAKELSLSSVQAQRIIKKHTGKTFGENLLEYRMTVANNLIETTDMTMEDVAAYVGYSSYSGFWKAYKKYTGKA